MYTREQIITLIFEQCKYYNLINNGVWKARDKGYSLYTTAKNISGLFIHASFVLDQYTYNNLIFQVEIRIGRFKIYNTYVSNP